MPMARRFLFNPFVMIGILVCLTFASRGGWAGASNGEAPIVIKPDKDKDKNKDKDKARKNRFAAETVDLGKESGPVRAPGVGIHAAAGQENLKDGIASIRIQATKDEVERGADASFVLEGPEAFLNQAAGRYVLQDDHGRELHRAAFKVGALKPDQQGQRTILIPTFNALNVKHVLKLVLVGLDDQRVERSAELNVLHRYDWEGWVGLLHAPYAEPRWDQLKKLGLAGGMAYRLNAKRMTALRSAGVPFYVENLAYGLFSRYHAQKGLWAETIAGCLGNKGAHSVLARKPSFSSVSFATEFAAELKRHGRIYKNDHPLFYSVASEPSVTRLAAAFDFDFDPAGLNDFRRWLEREVYGTLPALNEAWGTTFKRWDAVVPMTTFDTQLRLKDKVMNFAPWLDFRVFQDVRFANILKEGGALLRIEDPEARLGITGAMGAFAFGGWDWARLADSLDVVEAYDISQARALWRDLAPGKPALISVNLHRNPLALRDAKRSIWKSVLDGGPRGALIWDVSKAAGKRSAERVLLDTDGNPTPAALDLKSTLVPLSGALGKLLASAKRAPPVVGLLYSPNSVRMSWLLEASALHGEKWLENWGADTTRERKESSQLKLRESWSKLLSDLGLPWRFVSTTEIEKGLLSKSKSMRVLVLPRTLAMSDLEVEHIKKFVKAGGTVLADAACARFDQHGRIRKQPAFDSFFGINTSKDHYLPQVVNPLIKIEEIPKKGKSFFLKTRMSQEELAALPPVFSDVIKWSDTPPALRCEYRKSPVLVRKRVGKGQAIYLNLNLDEYFRSRLTKDSRRVETTLKILNSLAFVSSSTSTVVDVKASQLPWGTELVRLQLPDGSLVVALRRNTQSRLHELGGEGHDNRAFQKAEPFELVFRKKYWVTELLGGKPQTQMERIKGRLDPVTPAIWVVSKTAFAPISFKVVIPLTTKDHFAVRASVSGSGPESKGKKGTRLGFYEMRIFDPTGSERYDYGGSWKLSSRNFSLDLPLALSDQEGIWIVVVRELLSGTMQQLEVNVKWPD